MCSLVDVANMVCGTGWLGRSVDVKRIRRVVLDRDRVSGLLVCQTVPAGYLPPREQFVRLGLRQRLSLVTFPWFTSLGPCTVQTTNSFKQTPVHKSIDRDCVTARYRTLHLYKFSPFATQLLSYRIIFCKIFYGCIWLYNVLSFFLVFVSIITFLIYLSQSAFHLSFSCSNVMMTPLTHRAFCCILWDLFHNTSLLCFSF